MIRSSTSQTLMVNMKVSWIDIDSLSCSRSWSGSEPASQDSIVKTGKFVPLQNFISKISHKHFFISFGANILHDFDVYFVV